MIRVILADDHGVVRAGLRAIISTASDIEVVADATNGREAVTVAAHCEADVVVMDLSMHQLDGIAATREIVAGSSSAKVLVLTMHSAEQYLLAAIDAGASGYLVKSAADSELVDAIRALARGYMYVQPTAARVLAGRAQRITQGTEDGRLMALLSAREREVLRLVAEGFAGPVIGEQLAISAKTVDTYKQRIAEKLGVSGRPAFVRFALRVGLLTLGTSPMREHISPDE